jgi:LysM repeat protein
LEEQLRNNYRPQTGWLATWGQVSPALRWVALMVLLALVLSWSIKNLVPAPQPAINNTSGETETLSPTVRPTSTIQPLIEYKVGEGDTCAVIAAKFGVSIQSIVAMNQLSSDCLVSVGQMLKIPHPTPAPEPSNPTATPAKQEGGYDFRGVKLYLAQPLPESPDQAHIYLLKKDEAATLDQARALADRFGIQGEVYTAPDYIFSTRDYAFSDGKQMLQVYSDRFFTYTADMAKSRINPYGVQFSDQAEGNIQEFLKARGFDFSFSLSEGSFPGEYILKPLAPDSIPMQYESFTQPVMRVGLDEKGEVLSIDAVLMDYEPPPVGEYGIISAQEAFQILLNDNILAGKMEFFSSADRIPREWYRTYPDNAAVTIYGYLSSYPAADPGKPALIQINGVSVTGNITGLENLDDNTFVKATGQYEVENGVRKFNVQSWDRKIQETTVEGNLRRQGDQIIITSGDGSGKQFPLIEPSADVPLDTKLPDTQLAVSGVIVDGKLDWTYIQYFVEFSSSGGGGGNGIGFYKLNLDGLPVSFPPSPTPPAKTGNIEYVVKEGDTILAIAEAYGTTPEKIFEANSLLDGGTLTPGKTIIVPASQQPASNPGPFIGAYTVKEGDTLTAIAQTFGTTVDTLIQLNNLTDSNIYIGQTLYVPMAELPEQPVQDLRGYLSITIHNKSDGTSSNEYALDVIQDQGSILYTMAGPILSELDPYNALPILVTGKMDKTGKLVVDSYKIPYPDLHFQILKGTQKTEQLAGQNVVVFTTPDGKSYVEYAVTNNIPNTTSIIGQQGDLIEQEVLIIPDETFGGLPVAHIYQSSIVQENGPQMEPRANQIYTTNESDLPGLSPDYVPPNLTIGQVELVYYVSNPYYQVNDPNYSQRSPYIQPVWHFRGHYEDGGEFDVLIQALKQEFLLPELAPGLSPG